MVTVWVSGEVDSDTAGQLRQRLHSAVAAATGGRLVIDVSGMPLAAVAAVAVLRDAVKAAALAHVEVSLIGVRPDVAPVIAKFGACTPSACGEPGRLGGVGSIANTAHNRDRNTVGSVGCCARRTSARQPANYR